MGAIVRGDSRLALDFVLKIAKRPYRLPEVRVFFHLDILHLIDEVDDALKFRIETSVQRLEYLERLVKAVR